MVGVLNVPPNSCFEYLFHSWSTNLGGSGTFGIWGLVEGHCRPVCVGVLYPATSGQSPLPGLLGWEPLLPHISTTASFCRPPCCDSQKPWIKINLPAVGTRVFPLLLWGPRTSTRPRPRPEVVVESPPQSAATSWRVAGKVATKPSAGWLASSEPEERVTRTLTWLAFC